MVPFVNNTEQHQNYQISSYDMNHFPTKETIYN